MPLRPYSRPQEVPLHAAKFRIFLVLLIFLYGCKTPQEQQAVSRENFAQVYEKVKIESLDHTQLDAYLFRPKLASGSNNKRPAIVALHGCTGLFNSKAMINARDLDWGTRLAEKGYWVIYPDSFTTRGLKEICTRKDMKMFPRKTRTLDALGALNWLKNQPSVDSTKLALMGWSNGAGTLLWTLLDSRAQDFKLAIAFYPGCSKVEKVEDLRFFSRLEILMGELDNWTGPESCKRLVEKLKSTKSLQANITLYSGAYHGFDQPGMPLHERTGLANTVTGRDKATVGTHETSRKLSILKVEQLLEGVFQ